MRARLRTVRRGGRGLSRTSGSRREKWATERVWILSRRRLLLSVFGRRSLLTAGVLPRPQGVQRGTPATPQRSRIFRSPTGTCVGASRSPYTWSSPGCSPARRWRPPTSEWVSARLPALTAGLARGPQTGHLVPGTDTPVCLAQVQLRALLLQLREKLPCGGGVAAVWRTVLSPGRPQ